MRNDSMPTNDSDVRIAIIESDLSRIKEDVKDIKGAIKDLDLKIDTKYDKSDEKFERMMAKIDAKFDTFDRRLWSGFLWLLGAMGALFVTMGHGFHWF